MSRTAPVLAGELPLTAMTPPAPAGVPGSSRAASLAAEAADAAQVRAFSQHPDVVALRVEKVRTQVDWLVWIGIALGLGFTMANVQHFAATGAAVWSLAWCAAWLLDPMVSLVLIAVLRAEQITSRWQVGTDAWVNRTKWFCFAATYAMNTWQSWVGWSVSGIVLHSVPPVLVFLASQMAPVLRDRLTEAVIRAADRHAPDTTTTATTVTSTATTATETAEPDLVAAVALPAAAPARTAVVAPESACEQTRPLPRITVPVATARDQVPTDAAAIAVQPRDNESTPKSGRGSAAPRKRSGGRSRSGGRKRAPVRSMEVLRAELAAAVDRGEMTAPPSAEQIRTTLGVGPDRARALRDEYADQLADATA